MMRKDGAAVMDAASPKTARGPGRSAGTPSLRRDLGEDFAPRRRSLGPVGEMVSDEEDYAPRRRMMGGLRFRLQGGIPRSIVGRVLATGVVLAGLGATTFGLWEFRALVMGSSRLVVPSSAAIQITGNNHLSRAQLLTVFGEDVDRNILTVSLNERRAQLERLPWVEHATVMRLLPNKFRVAIVERKPVAFVRQGGAIGLVDANGVLLDMASDGDTPVESHYSFPVVTGISGQDPLSVRSARMKLFKEFTSALGEHAKNLSEVDLSSPEDVKALIPDGTADILVHFGNDDFLHRYELYQKNLPGWKTQYPKLASADMRYERQVVLEMQPGAAVPVASEALAKDETAAAASKAVGKAAVKVAGKPHVKAPVPAPRAAKAADVPAAPAPVAGQHLSTAFDVHAKTQAKSTQAVPQ